MYDHHNGREATRGQHRTHDVAPAVLNDQPARGSRRPTRPGLPRTPGRTGRSLRSWRTWRGQTGQVKLSLLPLAGVPSNDGS
jgi:hypothetical protein